MIFKKLSVRQCSFFLFLRYCCTNIGPYDQLDSGVKGSKVFKFQEETKKNSEFSKIAWTVIDLQD